MFKAKPTIWTFYKFLGNNNLDLNGEKVPALQINLFENGKN